MRLGHVSITTLHHISFLSNKDLQNVRDCNIRALAKQHRLPFSTSEISTAGIFDLPHLDLWGIYRQSVIQELVLYLLLWMTILEQHGLIFFLTSHKHLQILSIS